MSQLPEHHEDHPVVVSRNARWGLVLFLIYFAIYAGYLLLNVFAPRAMSENTILVGQDRVLVLSVNLAVGYGIALILIAILLSLVYMRVTKQPRP